MLQDGKDKTETAGGDQPISRKEALLKVGKYAAFTAAAMMAILEPAHAQPPKSTPEPPGAPPLKKAKRPRTDPPPSF